METSARNVFSGKVVAVNSGAVNDEVELAVEGGINIVGSSGFSVGSPCQELAG